MRRLLRPSLTAVVLAVLAAASLRAQKPETPRGCPAEEWPRDSVVSPNHGGLALFMATFLFVPSATLLHPAGRCTDDVAPLEFMRMHASLAAGGGGYANNRRGGWAGSVRAEAIVGRVYGEFRFERYNLGGSVRLRGGRVGYLLHPVPSLAGGVTVGYREASIDEDALEGLEIAFPFFSVMG
ncbi:MAG TPA: hypothetical protein VFQ45_12385, partial [Longimicrobium sp.]|nr:hypothetical protein [Longimicrobium sp.]